MRQFIPVNRETIVFLIKVHRIVSGRAALAKPPYCKANATVNAGGIAPAPSLTGTGFAITSQNSAVSWPAASQQPNTWTVAGTTAAPISCANVQIALSTNLGQSFPTILSASTPNDGAETITAPLIASTQARVRVQCVGNIFFDINNANISTEAALFRNGFE